MIQKASLHGAGDEEFFTMTLTVEHDDACALKGAGSVNVDGSWMVMGPIALQSLKGTLQSYLTPTSQLLKQECEVTH